MFKRKYICGVDHQVYDCINWENASFETSEQAIKYIISRFYCERVYIAQITKNNKIIKNSIKCININNMYK